MFQITFMQTYGYLQEPTVDSAEGLQAEFLYAEEAVVQGIKNIQKFGNVEVTGVLDEDTIKLFSAQRCGVKDVLSSKERQRRYIIGSKNWGKRQITYLWELFLKTGSEFEVFAFQQCSQLESKSGRSQNGEVAGTSFWCVGAVQQTEVQEGLRSFRRHHHRIWKLLSRRSTPLRRSRKHSGTRLLSLRRKRVWRRHSLRQRWELEGERNTLGRGRRLSFSSSSWAGALSRLGALTSLQFHHVPILQRRDQSAARLWRHPGHVPALQ